MAYLELKNIKKSFGDVNIIKGVDLEIQKGEFIVFVGPSGCGKSTLLRLIAGLEPITSGNLLLDGKDITWAPSGKRDLAMVFQSYALYPHMSVYDNMSFALKLAGTSKSEIKTKVEHAAKTLNLTQYLDRLPKDLSGGQRQRVAIGRAIVRAPKVFLFDEPLSNLDAALRGNTRVEIHKLHRALGATTIYVTHDQVEAMTLGSRIAVMKGGVVQQLGTPDEIYNRPANTYVATFIGSPTMNLLRGGVLAGGQFGIQGVALDLLPPPGSADMLLGVRPEHLVLHEDAPWRGQVSVVEPTGPDTYVMVDTAAGPVTLRTDAQTRVRPGDRVGLSVAPAHAHWFDAPSETRMAA